MRIHILLMLTTALLVLNGCNQQQPDQQQQQTQAQSKSGTDSESGTQAKSGTKTQSENQKPASEDPMCNPTPIRHFDAENQAKAIAEQIQGIDRSIVVQIDKEMNVAVEVSNFNRLRLEEIRKEVSQKLKAAFPKTNVHVTSDKKLIMELQKLSDKPWSTKQEEACKQKKTMKKIEKDMKG